MSRYWRLAGNAGYDASLDRVRDRLRTAGFTDAEAAPGSPKREAKAAHRPASP